MFENKKVFILGMAKSGYEAAKLLSNYHNEIFINDQKEQDENQVKELESLGVTFKVTDKPEEYLDNKYDVLVKNPGILPENPCVVKARELNIPVINEVELAYHYLPEDIEIIAVTGSNGKTTTVTLIYEFLKKAGKSVHLGGNIGYPLSSLVEKVKKNDILVLEISNYQLLDMKDFKANISVITNLSPTHLDLHGTYENYVNTKKKIFMNQTDNDIAVLNYESSDVLNISNDLNLKKIYFSSKEKKDAYIEGYAIYYKNEEIIKLNEIKIKGIHNYENIMSAIIVSKEFGVSNEAIKDVLNVFAGVEHRIEFVRTINGISFYNDSKSTNPKSTITALRSFTEPTILIMGGYNRSEDFSVLKDEIKNVKCIIGYGESKEKIENFAKENAIECFTVERIKDVVPKAYSAASAGDVILLSPGCASWDQYDHFEERGNEFKQLVNDLV